MPNWIQNIITVPDDDIKKLHELLLNKGEVDFNKLIPMPKELEDTQSPANVVPDDEYQAKLKEYDNSGFGKPISQSMSDELIKKFGFNNWYNWSIENWDTKWNAHDTIIDDETILFQTAWSMPEKVIAKLSTLMPDTIIEVKYADEDIGSNCGEYTIKNGEILSERTFATDEEARAFANEIWGFEEEEESE